MLLPKIRRALTPTTPATAKLWDAFAFYHLYILLEQQNSKELGKFGHYLGKALP